MSLTDIVRHKSMHPEGVAVQILTKGVERALDNNIRHADASKNVGLPYLAHVRHHKTGSNTLDINAVLPVLVGKTNRKEPDVGFRSAVNAE